MNWILKLLTFGLYGSGKVKKSVKRYRKDGKLRTDKVIEREGTGTISNGTDVDTSTPYGSNSFNPKSLDDDEK